MINNLILLMKVFSYYCLFVCGNYFGFWWWIVWLVFGWCIIEWFDFDVLVICNWLVLVFEFDDLVWLLKWIVVGFLVVLVILIIGVDNYF